MPLLRGSGRLPAIDRAWYSGISTSNGGKDATLTWLDTFSVDWPGSLKTAENPISQAAVAVAEKILSRGSLTECSPRIAAIFGGSKTLGAEEIRSALLAEWTTARPRHFRDAFVSGAQGSPDSKSSSEEELIFFERLLPVWDIRLQAYCDPQVPARNFAQHKELSNRRPDFFLCLPDGTRVVIEINGDQHSRPLQEAVDERSRTALESEGIRVFEVPAREIREGSGERLNGLKSYLLALPFLRQPIATPDAVVRRAVWGPVVIHRLQMLLWEGVRNGLLPPGEPEWRLRVLEDDLAVAQDAVADFLDFAGNLKDNAGALKAIAEELKKLPAMEESRKAQVRDSLSELLTPIRENIETLGRLTAEKTEEQSKRISNLESAVGLVSKFLADQAQSQSDAISRMADSIAKQKAQIDDLETTLSGVRRLSRFVAGGAGTGAVASAAALWKLFH